MKTRKRFILCVCGTGVLAVATSFYLSVPSQPIYQERTLLSWLNDLTPAVSYQTVGSPLPRMAVSVGVSPALGSAAPGSPVANRNLQLDAADGVRKMGTNSFPFLLALLRKEDSDLKVRLLALLKKHSWLKLNPISAEQRHAQALAALHELGPLAAPLWKALLLERRAKSNLRVMAVVQLGSLLPEPQEIIPLLLKETDGAPLGSYANSAILHYGAQTAVPILQQYIGGTNLHQEAQAMRMLQSFGTRAKAVVPSLLRRLECQHAAVREQAAVTLLSCDPKNIPAMLSLLPEPPLSRRLAICWGLEQVHEQPAAAVPALMSCLRDPEAQIREAAAEALAAYAAEAGSASSVLGAMVEDPDYNVRRAVTNALSAVRGPAR